MMLDYESWDFYHTHPTFNEFLTLQGNYRLAKQHYTIALRYEPDNRNLIENLAVISRLEHEDAVYQGHADEDEVNTGEMYDEHLISLWVCFTNLTDLTLALTKNKYWMCCHLWCITLWEI